jgi:hypothetical protein
MSIRFVSTVFALIAFGLPLLSPTPSHASGPGAVVLHVVPANGLSCAGAPTQTDNIVTEAAADPDGPQYFVYVLGVPGALGPALGLGVAGFQFGIEYTADASALAVLGWHTCSDLDFKTPTWPAPDSGIALTWNPQSNCQREVLAGYFTVAAYAPASMAVVAHPTRGTIAMANCTTYTTTDADLVDLARVGWVSLGGGMRNGSADGCNPLLGPCTTVPTPTQPSTWGKVKSLYN